MNRLFPHKQNGFSLVELMIALVLGTLMMATMIQLFISSKQSYRVNENLSRLQENGRFAMSFISKDIRMADYRGCLNDTKDIASSLNSDANFDSFAHGISGKNNDNNSNNSTVDGTDIITLRGVFNRGVRVSSMPASTSASLKIENNSGLKQNDMVMVGDCLAGDIFQITSVTSDSSGGGGESDNVAHGIGSVNSGPGNTSKIFQKTYGTDAKVYRLNFATYSIQTGNSDLPSLYRSVNGSAAQELVEGVENMQIIYGEDTDGDHTPNFYLAADDAALSMDKVVSVRVSLLLRSVEDNLALKPVPYTIFGVKTTPNDKIIRRVFTSTIAVRNRLP